MSVVAKRSSMTLFSDPDNHYSHRARIVLAEKGVTADIVDIEPHNYPAELSELVPYNALPTLLDRDLVLYESKVIMEYLDERFPHPPLLPVYPVARAQTRLWIHRIEKDWSPLVDTILGGQGSEEIAVAKKELKEGLLSASPIFAEKPFFMSDEFTLADCCLAAILWRLEKLELSLGNSRQAKLIYDYKDRLCNREGFQISLTEAEKQ